MEVWKPAVDADIAIISVLVVPSAKRADVPLCLQLVADFATLVGTYARGFAVITEPFDSRTPNIPDPVIQVLCGLQISWQSCSGLSMQPLDIYQGKIFQNYCAVSDIPFSMSMHGKKPIKHFWNSSLIFCAEYPRLCPVASLAHLTWCCSVLDRSCVIQKGQMRHF